MQLHVLSDIDSYYRLISDKWTESDWPIWFVIELLYWDSYERNPSYKYHCSISVVAPEAVPADEIASACRCVGLDQASVFVEEVWKDLPDWGKVQIETLESHLVETRELLDRSMHHIGKLSTEEFRDSPGGEYMRLFLDGKLEEAFDEQRSESPTGVGSPE